MSVTLSVLKLETSSDVRLGQFANIKCMFFTLYVLKFETSSEVRPIQE